MEKFLYLTEVEWTDTWVNGGEIPIKLASTYSSDTRDGTETPDENLVHQSAVPIPSLRQHGYYFENVRNLTFTNNYSNGVRLPDLKSADYYTQDGLILSFCNSFDLDIAKRVGKKVCVKITNIQKTKKRIDKQLGCKGHMALCQYTSDHQRNHFLKSVEDSWQDEFRIFWETTQEKWVKIPEGTAELIWIDSEI